MRRLAPKKSKVGSFARSSGAEDQGTVNRRRVARWAALTGGFLVIALSMTKLPERETSGLLENLDREIVASERLQAAFSFETVDLKLTEERRKAEEAKAPFTYAVRQDTVREQLNSLQARIAAIRAHQEAVAERLFAALRASTPDTSGEEIANKTVLAYVEELRDEPLLTSWDIEPRTLGVWLTPDAESLPERRFPEEEGAPAALQPDSAAGIAFPFADALRTLTRENFEAILREGVRSADLGPEQRDRRIVVMREGNDGTRSLSEEMALADVPDPARAAELLRARLEAAARQWARVEGEPELDWGKLSDAALDVARPLLAGTLYHDEDATRQARMQKYNAAEPVYREIQARETIIDEGERWNPQARSDARAYLQLLQSSERPESRLAASLAAHAILTLLALLALKRALDLFGPKLEHERVKLLYLALLLLGATLLVGRAASYMEPSGIVVPVAAPAILFAILVNVRLAAMFSVLAAGLLSAQYGYDWRLAVFALAMSLAGAFSIFKVRRRSDMTAATLKAAGTGLAAMAALTLAMDGLATEAAARYLALAGINGFICMFIVPGLLPPLERLFGITTDIQLLEYSDLNNEVLGRLAMEVPATWSHSLMMGQLAETVAEAIGANGLLTRVCAYYHDIGKMRRPEYFSENQTGANIHDELAPRLSARAIASHVTHGVELAREYHLPQPIIDGILEHHGTTLISFFHQRAQKNAKHGDVREEDFRYPGPRPRSRETAILMICDGVESGVRSIKNPNEERVREFVDKIIQMRANDRQFDDCDLTLKDLDIIAELLTRRVLGAHHTRIAYPNMDKDKEKGGGENIIALPGGNVS